MCLGHSEDFNTLSHDTLKQIEKIPSRLNCGNCTMDHIAALQRQLAIPGFTVKAL